MGLLAAIRNYIAMIREETEKAHGSPVPKNWIGQTTMGEAWIGVDLDGTLAWYDPGASLTEIGPPVEPMIHRVRQMLAEGWQVKIFTARAGEPQQLVLIQQWLKEHGLPPLEITNKKDFNMIRLYDDRCVQVESNTGRILSENAQKGNEKYTID